MSPIYEDGNITMDNIMDYMWENDRSGVFDFDALTITALKQKTMTIRLFVQVHNVKDDKTTEREFGTETFAILIVSKLARFCGTNNVKIRVDAKYVDGDTLSIRKKFSWK